jgi:hypothetical protein
MTQNNRPPRIPGRFTSHPIVFWNDIDGEFLTTIENLALANVKLIRLHETPALQVKIDSNCSAKLFSENRK